MIEDRSSGDDADPTAREPSGQEHAEAAIRAIAAGADPATESFILANRFTDAQTVRFGSWLRRILGRSRST